MSSSELLGSEPANLKSGTSPDNRQDEKKDSDFYTSSPKATINSIHERSYNKFDHDALLAEYDDDYQKDAAFEAGLLTQSTLTEFTTRMMDLLLETRAWALARPRLETERQGLLLLEEIKSIQAAEAEQGAFTLLDRVRIGLMQFVQNIKSALAALANLV